MDPPGGRGLDLGKFLLSWRGTAPHEGRRQKGTTHQGFIDQMETDKILSAAFLFTPWV